ncbi:MAG: hypothetical protein P1V35_14965 [Planctomycetota bacterium]|nr:hypothetical protein [Planctomycetota bacterium]
MLNLFRLTFLILSLGVAGFFWAYGSHPEWVGRVDRWICDRHLAPTEELWVRVQSPKESDMDGRLHADVLAHLTELGNVHPMERRFELWRNLVLWYVAEGIEWGELDMALDWQARLVGATPSDLEQKLVWVNLLMEKGGPSNLTRARELLSEARRVVPDWSPALELDMRLSLLVKDWKQLTGALTQWSSGGGEEFAQGWQWFTRTSEQGKMQASTRLASKPTAEPNQKRVEWKLSGEHTYTALRVDPPAKSTGELVDVRFFGEAAGGRVMELKAKSAKECAWYGDSMQLQLRGRTDPRMVLEPVAEPLVSVWIQFQTWRATPDWILQAAKKHPKLRKHLVEAGFVGPIMEEVR